MNKNLVPILTTVGGLGGLLFLALNWNTVRTRTYRATRDVADRAGFDLPTGFREAMLPDAQPMPQFGVGFGHMNGGATFGARAPATEPWVVDTNAYWDTWAMLSGSSAPTGTAPPPSTTDTGSAAFGVRAPTL